MNLKEFFKTKTDIVLNDCFNNKDYVKMVDYFGVNEIFNFVPFQVQRIQKALIDGDMHLNTLPIKQWDNAGGIIVNDYTGKVFFTDGLFNYLNITYNINCASSSQMVSLLKTCAIMYCSENIDFEFYK